MDTSWVDRLYWTFMNNPDKWHSRKFQSCCNLSILSIVWSGLFLCMQYFLPWVSALAGQIFHDDKSLNCKQHGDVCQLELVVRSSMMISLFLTQSLQFRRINPKSLAIACSLVHSPFISWFRIPEFLVKVWFIMAHGPKFHDYPDSLAVHSPQSIVQWLSRVSCNSRLHSCIWCLLSFFSCLSFQFNHIDNTIKDDDGVIAWSSNRMWYGMGPSGIPCFSLQYVCLSSCLFGLLSC